MKKQTKQQLNREIRKQLRRAGRSLQYKKARRAALRRGQGFSVWKWMERAA